MHGLIRTTQLRNRSFYVLNRCSYSHQTVKCVCADSISKKKHLYPQKLHNLNNAMQPINLLMRNLCFTSVRFNKDSLKPDSKVEATVKEIIKKKDDLLAAATLPPKEVIKKSIKQKIVDELLHYYHGFKLLFIDVKISAKLVFRILKGRSLTRREHRLLVRTVSDMFRLIPFSVFIVVPFMELFLPLFIKLFPNMLPSTFQTDSDQEAKIKQTLKVKLQMATFLQKTLSDMTLEHKDHKSEQAKEFSMWFNKVRTTGDIVSNEDIMKFSKLFEDEITLDSLSRSQLVALCRVLEVQTLGTNNFLRFQLRMKLRSLAADDKMIQKEGVDSLTYSELQAACRARGIRAFGVADKRLRQQLTQWLDLSLNERVPPSLLLLSRALMLPETIPTHDQLKVTISSLPDTVITQTKVAIGEKEGKIDNKSKIEALREEERKISEEREEVGDEATVKKEKKKKDVLIDKAPILKDPTRPMIDRAKVITSDMGIPRKPAEKQLETKDIQVIEEALNKISEKEKSLALEKEKLQGLKEELKDYQEDVNVLHKTIEHEEKPEIKESVAAKRLFKRVHTMVTELDTVLKDITKDPKEGEHKKDVATEDTAEKKEEVVDIENIMDVIRKSQSVPDESREVQIRNLLKKLDDDYDGAVKLEQVLKVIEMLGKDTINLSPKQMDEVIELLGKEEILEAEDKILKALKKEKEQLSKHEKPKKEVDESNKINVSPPPVPDNTNTPDCVADSCPNPPSKAPVTPPAKLALAKELPTAVKEDSDLKNVEGKR